MTFGFCGSHYVSESPIADNQATINYYPEVVESGSGRGQIVLYPTPGLLQFGSSPPTAAVRGMVDVGDDATGRLFAVIGNTLYEFNSVGTRTARGTLNSSSGNNISMAASDTQVLIIDGTNGYVFTLATNVFAQVSSGGFPANPVVAGYSDGYFIVLSTDNYFYISTVNDATTWSAADRERVQAPSNSAVGMAILNRQVWIFGGRITQPFWNSGNPDFPFEANLSGTMNQGLAARFGVSVIPDANTIAWLGHNDSGMAVAYIADGYNPVRISDHSFETAVSGYSTISDAVSFCFQYSGHVFWSITFPTAKETWRYDFTASQQAGRPMWHKALYWKQALASYEAHRAMFHAHVFGKHIVGDRENGKLYEMKQPSLSQGTASFVTDDGDVIRRIRRCPHLHSDNKTVFYKSLTIIAEPGLGTSLGQGQNPSLSLDVSDDGGKTYSFTRIAQAGRQGQYRQRLKYDYLGSARDRVFQTVATDPIPWRLIGAELEAEAGLT